MPTKLKVKESQVVRDCKWLLSNLRAFNRLLYRTIHVPIARETDYVQKQRAFEMAGIEDLQIYLPGGKILHVEFKSSSGRQREAQKTWEKDLKEIGHVYKIIRSVEEMKELLTSEGVQVNFNWS